MRPIEKIIFHCTATKEGQDIDIDTVRNWHTTPVNMGGRGWTDIGYHFLIYLDGTIMEGRPIEKIGAHTYGENAYSIGICYVGGIGLDKNPKDTRTEAQKTSMENLLKSLLVRFPKATIHGHYEFANKACPSFNVQEWVKEINL